MVISRVRLPGGGDGWAGYPGWCVKSTGRVGGRGINKKARNIPTCRLWRGRGHHDDGDAGSIPRTCAECCGNVVYGGAEDTTTIGLPARTFRTLVPVREFMVEKRWQYVKQAKTGFFA